MPFPLCSKTRQDKPPKQLQLIYSFSDFQSFIPQWETLWSLYIVLNKYLHDTLHEIYKTMMLGLMHDAVLDCYKNTVTTLIPKGGGQPKIHWLRPIHIIESELQALTKSQWAKNLLKNAGHHNLLADSQCGGRAQRQMYSAILNKTLIYDIHRTLAKDLTSVDEDLKAKLTVSYRTWEPLRTGFMDRTYLQHYGPRKIIFFMMHAKRNDTTGQLIYA